jgi:hypothetical protein
MSCPTILKTGNRAGEVCGRLNCRYHNKKQKKTKHRQTNVDEAIQHYEEMINEIHQYYSILLTTNDKQIKNIKSETILLKKKLEKINIKNNSNITDNNYCSICYCDYEPTDNVISMYCGHKLHFDCALKLYHSVNGKYRNKCPECRCEIFENEKKGDNFTLPDKEYYDTKWYTKKVNDFDFNTDKYFKDLTEKLELEYIEKTFSVYHSILAGGDTKYKTYKVKKFYNLIIDGNNVDCVLTAKKIYMHK